ncbi:Ppx/GppA family phosphatase [Limimaricola pyoseonensis]|uniref:Exopolyphosphatase / guanosine-5'-triphosphate,3'-diphosphate pyrophosphatase n=1 Tax=Limimaricola pyoseonensis TaxID=521013 RepID=A0A1G7D0V8_9RHOB|nr:Ppx/GppA family phosphatase [Limimaricola pyoseonensis]SDE45113.1 exopolyphosphatase / guanosine-5'-triphosphate,3'-diphosphate pyrophosphatase [Limimaricola pyoseonensis]
MNENSDASSGDWGPFGRPLFNDPESRALSRVGVVDVGSNSVRLVVFDGAARSPAYFYNEKIMCGLGAGLSETGKLSPEGRERALKALKRFATLAEGMNIVPLTAVATAAVREAEDGPEFCEQVLRETGIEVHTISGDEEARLSAQGVLLGWPGSYGLVCDIGGSSMELADIAEGRVGRRLTSALGPLKLKEVKGGDEGLEEYIETTIARIHEEMGGETGMRLFLVGGSWRAIARCDMTRRDYPLTVLHEYRMTVEDVAETRKYIETEDPDDLRKRAGVSSDRMALVPLAIRVLDRLVKVFQPKDIAISSYGIREGMLYEQMPAQLRDRDPLIEACRFAEAKDARLPGFGPVLYDFVRPLFPHADWQRKRIIKAACLLHDVSWRAHPDYRPQVCFDNATRANLGGLKHSERVFLGLALMHRYSNKREGARYEQMFTLVRDEDKREAEVLGKAMRLGAMLWLGTETMPGSLAWNAVDRVLKIELDPRARNLFGEVAEQRFNSLVSALDATGEVAVRD